MPVDGTSRRSDDCAKAAGASAARKRARREKCMVGKGR
jgi:hypothetical protein